MAECTALHDRTLLSTMIGLPAYYIHPQRKSLQMTDVNENGVTACNEGINLHLNFVRMQIIPIRICCSDDVQHGALRGSFDHIPTGAFSIAFVHVCTQHMPVYISGLATRTLCAT